MKLFFRTCFLIACVFGMASCSSESFLDEPTEVAKVQNQFRVPLSDALQVAEDVMSSLDEGKTRSQRIISSVEVKSYSSTRANFANDTLFYLVNYANDEGFALLGADKRLPSLYAISDEGHFEFSDTLSNPGLSFYMAYIEERASNKIRGYGEDASVNDLVPNPNLTTNRYEVYPPRLPLNIKKVHGFAPYNKYCYANDGTKALTGCMPTAIAMYMSSFKYPTSYGGYSFNWDEILENPENDGYYRLIRMIGNKENMDATYHPNETGTEANYTNVVRTFENMGFEVEHGFVSFDEEEVLARVNKGWGYPLGMPVLVRGAENGKNIGHAWLIDGAMKQKMKDIVGADGSRYDSTIPMLMFHCIWGWRDGRSNGYFSFDEHSLGGIPNRYDKDDAGELASSPLVFDRYLMNFGQIKIKR